MEPFKTTVPMFWSMEADVALAVVQLRVAEPPGAMVAGEALNVTVGGAAFTVTAVWAVALPLLFLTVMVKVVVMVGVTTLEPLTATLPMP